jgi:hypothetical protein
MQLHKMCHCKCSIRIHVKFGMRYPCLSLAIDKCHLFIRCWILFFMNFFHEYKRFFIAFVWQYIIYFILWNVCSIPYIIYYILYIIHYIYYTMYCILYIIYYTQYTIYNILNINIMVSIVFKYNSNVLFKNNE